MSKILKTAAPGAAHKKSWWLSVLGNIALAVVFFIFKFVFEAILDELASGGSSWAEKQGRARILSGMEWVSVVFVIGGVLLLLIALLEFWMIFVRGDTKIEVTEDGIQGVSCPMFAFFNRKFALKFNEIESVDAPKDIAMIIRAKGVTHVVYAEGSQEIVRLIKELKSR